MFKNRYLKWFFGVCMLAVLLLSFVNPVKAVEFREGNQVLIPAGEVIEDDLYVTGNTVTLEGTIKGDLIAFGTQIIIASSGVVEGDLLGAGRVITINGTVEGDARIAGAVLVIGEVAKVGEDMVGAAYSLETKPGSQIKGDLLYAGGQALLGGEVQGDARVAAQGLQLDGTVGGNLEASVGSPQETGTFNPFNFIPGMPSVPVVPGGLSIGANAQVGGDLKYQAPQQATIPPGIPSGETTYQELVKPAEEAVEPTPTQQTTSWLINLLQNFVSLLLVGLVLVWLAPGFVRRSSELFLDRPLPSLGWGFVGFFAFFFLLFLVALATGFGMVLFGVITLGDLSGLIFGLGSASFVALIVLFVLAVSFITKIIISFAIGSAILKGVKKDWSPARVWPLLVGLILFSILAAIPYLGILVNWLVIFLGLGAMWTYFRERWQAKKEIVAEAPVAS